MKKRIVYAHMFCLIVVAGCTTSQPPKDAKSAATPVVRHYGTHSERRAYELLGMSDDYDRYVSQGKPFNPKPALLSGEWSVYNNKIGTPVGVSWKPKPEQVTGLARSKVITECGQPDVDRAETVCYGSLTLDFDKNDTIKEIWIAFRPPPND